MKPLTPRTMAVAGLLFLALAGVLSAAEGPGGMHLWPFALVPTWFGVSHLVAVQTRYRGCPELGAIPSVFHGRTVHVHCPPWHRIDNLIGEAGAWPPRSPER